MTYDEIMPVLSDILCEILSLEPDEVNPNANFFDDLGGESLEVLELSFHCEKKFGVRIDFKKLFDSNTLSVNDDGSLPEIAILELEKQFPFLDLQNARNPQKGNVFQSLFTVQTIAGLVQQTLEKEGLKAG